MQVLRLRGRFVLAVWLVLPAVAGVAQEARGKLDAVTVYRGQALVTRLVDVPGPASLREIVVTDLPDSVLPGSIYAESSDGVEVRSVRYRVRPVAQDVREEVRKLDEQIQATQDKLSAVQRHIAVLAEHKAYLAKLEQFVAPTANVELTKGVLNAETLKLLSTFLLEQRQTAGEEELKLAVEQRGLTAQVELLQRQRQELTAGSARSLREAVVFVNVLRPEGAPMRLRYLVDKATWSPSYNARTGPDGKDVRLEYYASIQQMSGEDWTDVAMTLSTATPSLVAKAPMLTPLSVSLVPLTAGKDAQAAQQRALSPGDYANAKQELARRKMQSENARNQRPVQQMINAPVPQAQAQGEPRQQAAMEVDPDVTLNAIASEMQILDLVAAGARPNQPGKAAADEGVSVTYQLPGRTALPSRADQQLIQIASLPMKAEFYTLATPMLTSYVYQQAEVTNTSDKVLLAGPVSAYRAGQFVGLGEIPTVAVGEQFALGFGINASLRAGRELADRTESIQGGNRVVEFTYRLSIENFGTAPAQVRVLDRMPTAKDREVRIELVSTGQELSKDATYLQGERKKGLLRWELEAPAQAIGPKAQSIEYKLRLEYDRQMGISTAAVASR